MRKVYVNVTTKIIVEADEGVDIEEVMSELDYNFEDTTGKANVIDTEITDYDITDSK